MNCSSKGGNQDQSIETKMVKVLTLWLNEKREPVKVKSGVENVETPVSVCSLFISLLHSMLALRTGEKKVGAMIGSLTCVVIKIWMVVSPKLK